MAHRVVHPLLHHPKEGQGLLPIQFRVDQALQTQVHGPLLLEPGHQLRQGLFESQLQPGGVQLVAQPPQLLHALLGDALRQAKLLLQGGGVLRLHPGQADPLDQGRHVLQGAVVDLSGEVGLLLLLHPDQVPHVPFGQGSPVDGREGQVGDGPAQPLKLQHRREGLRRRGVLPPPQGRHLRPEVPEGPHHPAGEGPHRQKTPDAHEPHKEGPQGGHPEHRPQQLVPGNRRHHEELVSRGGVGRHGVALPPVPPGLHRLSQGHPPPPEEGQGLRPGGSQEKTPLGVHHRHQPGNQQVPGEKPQSHETMVGPVGLRLEVPGPVQTVRHALRQVAHVGAGDRLQRLLGLYQPQPRTRHHRHGGQEDGQGQEEEKVSPQPSSSSRVTRPYRRASSMASVLFFAPTLS